jgi:hypothetical protein
MQMDISEVLKFVDKAIYAKTGKHLNDLQNGIIEGIIKQQKYSEIADTYRLSEGHVKDVGYELLQMLSDTFKEPVDKRNLKSVLERQGNQNITFGNNNVFGYINICPDRVTTNPDQSPSANSNIPTAKNQSKIEIVSKLRQFGLNDEQIAEALSLPLEVVKQEG